MAAEKLPVPGSLDSFAEKLSSVSKVRMGSVELAFEPDDLDDKYQEKARTELRETAEVVEAALKELRALLAEEANLVYSEEEEYLRRFLRPCKWYPRSAFELMKRFYAYRRNHRRICDDLVPSKQEKIFLSGILTPLPIRVNDGVRVFLIEGGKKWKPKEVSLEEILRGVMLSLEAAIAEPKTQVSGVRVILDMDGLSLSHVTYFTPSFASAVVEWVQKCLPCRLKGVHIVNQPYIFNMVFAFFRPFLQEKLRKRIHFHGTNKQDLFKFIEPAVLPIRYGGEFDLPDEPIGEELWKYFCTFEDNFKVASQFGYTSKM